MGGRGAGRWDHHRKRSQGGDDCGRSQEVTPNSASRMKAHGGADGVRSHGGALVEMPGGSRGMTDRGGAVEGGDPGGAGELKRPCDTEGPGGKGRDMVMSGQGGARALED